MSAYEDGYTAGLALAENPDKDVRWMMADHAKAGTLAEFSRGLADAIDNKERNP